MSDTFRIELERLDGYRFEVDFGPRMPVLVVDEPPPLGTDSGPNPARLLAAAVGDCLSASLVFCLSKSKVEVAGLRTRVVGSYRRNERNRLRIGALEVELVLDTPASREQLEKCLGLFEDFCVVTATVRQGLEVRVRVVDDAGHVLFESSPESAPRD